MNLLWLILLAIILDVIDGKTHTGKKQIFSDKNTSGHNIFTECARILIQFWFLIFPKINKNKFGIKDNWEFLINNPSLSLMENDSLIISIVYIKSTPLPRNTCTITILFGSFNFFPRFSDFLLMLMTSSISNSTGNLCNS